MQFRNSVRCLIAAWACFPAASSIAMDAFIYPDLVTPSFEKEDAASAKNGYKKCEISATLMKLPEGVDLRVKVLSDGRTVQSSLTVDVVKFTVSNGVPFDPRKVPISSADVLSNIFQTTPEMQHFDMGDGGIGILVKDPERFTALVKLIKRGDYIVKFKRTDKADETNYAVKDGSDQKVMGQFVACLNRM